MTNHESLNADGTVRLVELTRMVQPGGHEVVESVHQGALAVVAADGQLLAAAGNPLYVSFLRSSAKPFQALPTAESGALAHFGLDDRALALMCASHHGTEEHAVLAQAILDRIGLDETALRCGVHWPIDEEAARDLARSGRTPSPLHNNCSGKHAGMLTLARFWDLPVERYTEPEHPVQQAILARLADVTGLAPEAIPYALDGCTVPSFALPLSRAALAFARLIAPDAPAGSREIVAAMQAYPHLVSGHGALDDQVMQAGQGRIVCKGGAEGYWGLGIRAPDGRAVGLALKIADGNARGKGVVLVETLARLGLVDAETLGRLEPLHRPERTNHRGLMVGHMRPVVPFPLVAYDPPRLLEQLQ